MAHVDTRKKPDVFYRLKELRPGREIYVSGNDGDTALSTVDSSDTVLKSLFPSESIWVASAEPLIRLITCGGEWDSGIGHYLSNVVVYGHLVG